VTELDLPHTDGMAILKRALEARPDVTMVVIGEAPEAVAQKADVLPRPIQIERLLALLERGFAHQAVSRRAAELETRLNERFGFERFTGHGPALNQLIERARQLTRSTDPVLLIGESGTGKALLAQAIHQNSPRAAEPFVRVHVPAFPGDALEAELFAARGQIEAAEGGTLFLDEVGEFPSGIQDRLMRLLQKQEYERAGESTPRTSNSRVIASIVHNFDAWAAASGPGRDPHERLGVVEVRVPPLRERIEDIPLLVDEFLREFNREHGRRVTGITRGAQEQLLAYNWPGNVRELRNAMEAMVVFAEGRRPIDVSDLPQAVRNVAPAGRPTVQLAVGWSLAEAEKRFMEETLAAVSYDRSRAAEMLGIGLRTLYRMLKEYEIG
jgi:DNA-binding NtrC family response regulator